MGRALDIKRQNLYLKGEDCDTVRHFKDFGNENQE